ncbi:MAG: OPT/YSL family transporter [Phycisphaerales bacterium]
MAIPHLTDEQIRTWTPRQKDEWWLKTVYRGNMPQLTLRAGITGFLLGGVLSATNLYVGAKTGWSLGVGITSVILAFAMFRVMARMGLAKDFTILENNAMQSCATAAGYMTAPLISSLAAFMIINNRIMVWYQMIGWMTMVSLLGVLVAFPMKRRFINDEQQPFPEGRAAGVVLDALYQHDPENVDPEAGTSSGMFKAKALAVAALLAAFLKFIMSEGYHTFLQVKLMGLKAAYFIQENISNWYWALAKKNAWFTPTIGGVDIKQLALTFSLDLSMFGAGGLMGTRIANSLVVGTLLNFAVVAPLMIHQGQIKPTNGTFDVATQVFTLANGQTAPLSEAVFGRGHLLNTWCLWWGIAMMVAASMVGLLAKPKVLIGAFTGIFKKRDTTADPLRDIEFPLWVSLVGVPVVAGLAVWMSTVWFGINPWLGLLAIPLIIVLTLIAANATALTSTTPTGSLSKITQFTFGAMDKNPATNLITAGMTSEVAGNASNLLMDIKPGYMLGAKPRQQAWAHCIGIVSGAIASVPLFFLLFLSKKVPDGTTIEAQLITDDHPMPGATIWKGVSDLITKLHEGGGSALPQSAVWAMIIAAGAAVIMESARMATRGKFWLSPLAIGLGVVIPPESAFMMFIGAWFFELMLRRNKERKGTFGWKLWVDSQEPVAAGIIAGAALVGIGDTLIDVFGDQVLGWLGLAAKHAGG